jgi:stage III sporulation protein AD
MTELVRIIGIALAGGVLAVTIRQYNPIFGMLTALSLGAFIMLSLCDVIKEVVVSISEIAESGGMEIGYIAVVMKVIGIAYISQFGAQMLRDSGENAIAAKCELAGKLFILYLTIPVIGDFLRMCISITEGF